MADSDLEEDEWLFNGALVEVDLDEDEWFPSPAASGSDDEGYYVGTF